VGVNEDKFSYIRDRFDKYRYKSHTKLKLTLRVGNLVGKFVGCIRKARGILVSV